MRNQSRLANLTERGAEALRPPQTRTVLGDTAPCHRSERPRAQPAVGG